MAERIRGVVAIVGMAALYPGAPDLTTYWANILGKVDAVSDPTPDLWDAATHFDPTSAEGDRVYCKRGGYIGPIAYFDPVENGVMPRAIDGGEPDQWLALRVARLALADAGYLDNLDARHRTAVVIGKGTYINRGHLTLLEQSLTVEQTLKVVRELHPEFGEDELAEIRRALKQSLPPFNADTVPGLVPNIIAGRIANRLDLMGPSYTVDAACASSLIASQIAMRDLLTHECDLALAGGSQITTSVPTFALFCQLNALSRRQEIRPFDALADGTILGEGVGMIVLKRLEDAERDGDRIYAVLRGVGTSSDGRAISVMAPRLEGEVLALERAYETAEVEPETIELIEAHGTATPVGDATEVEALTRVFGVRDGQPPRIALGSVKSMIGHTMPAAGMAGIIKTALALYHRVLPPTINVSEPNPKLGIDRSALYLNTEPRPWVHGQRYPRRAGVNAFGFGGINAHAVLEEYTGPAASPLPTHQAGGETEIFVLAADSRAALVERIDLLLVYLDRNPEIALKDLAFSLNTARPWSSVRLAIVALNVADLRAKLERGRKRLAEAKPRQLKDQSGIYYFPAPLGTDGKLVVLFPGEGAQYPTMLADVCVAFPEARAAFDRLDAVFADDPSGYRPSTLVFPPTLLPEAERKALDDRLWHIDGAVEAVLTANQALWSVVSGLGPRPDAFVGHSTGEYSAMRAAGILDVSDDADFARFTRDLKEGYRDAAVVDGVPAAGMLAIGADRDQAATLVAELAGAAFVAMDNCPHQTVLVGERSAIERARSIADRDGLIYEYLAFERAYHTPLFAPYLDHLRQAYGRAKINPPRALAYSCTSAGPYPDDPDEIRALMAEHWTAPVEFRRTIEALYDAGVRVFLEVGPRGNLSAFVEDILRGRSFCAIPTNVQRRSGLTQLNHAVALLAAQGIDLDLAPLYRRRDPRRIAWEDGEAPPPPEWKRGMKVATGVPSLGLADEIGEKLRARVRETAGPVASAEFAEPAPAAQAWTGQASRVSEDAALYDVGADQEQAETATTESELIDPAVARGLVPRLGGVGESFPYPTQAGDKPPHYGRIDQAGTWDATDEVGDLVTDEIDAVDVGDDERVSAVSGFDESDDATDRTAVEGETSALAYDPSDQNDSAAYPSDALAGESALSLSPTYPRIVGPLPPSASEAMSAFLRTMEHFLDVQGQVTSAFLGAATPPPLTPLLDAPTPETMIDDAAWDQDEAVTDDGLPDLRPMPPDPRPFPLLGELVAEEPGLEVVFERTFDLDQDRYLRDHTLGRNVSTLDPELRAFAVMPLTMSLEIAAEAASYLAPDLLLVGMRDVLAHRWIGFADQPQTLQVRAWRLDEENQIRVQIRNLTEDESSANPAKSPVLEVTALFAAEYPAHPDIPEIAPRNGRPSRWPPDRLYEDAMFHGPSWRGVAAIDQTGDDGIVAILPVLSWSGFFRDDPNPAFVLDPVVLDAAGQVIGFWTIEHLESGRLIFPFRLEALEIFGPLHPTGELTTCQARIELRGEQQVRSDIDVLDQDGRPWMRLIGWEDKRFDLPSSFFPLLLDPARAEVSTPWPEVLAAVPYAEPVRLRRVYSPFRSDRSFWKRVWAGCILGRTEREYFAALRTPETRQLLWLAGHAAAKEAALSLLRERYGLELLPADVEIAYDAEGCPRVTGAWREHVADAPIISIAHCDDLAVALAVFPDDAGGKGRTFVGVDLEKIVSRPAGFVDVAFDAGEQAILAGLQFDLREEWLIRCWCAKEAVAKALGYGLIEGPASVRIVDFDDEAGLVGVKLTGRLAQLYPAFAGRLVAYTRRDDDFIVATTFLTTKE